MGVYSTIRGGLERVLSVGGADSSSGVYAALDRSRASSCDSDDGQDYYDHWDTSYNEKTVSIHSRSPRTS